MRIAILGASGFVGRKLGKRLVASGHEVNGFVLKSNNDKSIGFPCYSIDRIATNDKSVSQPYDAIVNLAARRSTKYLPYSYEEVHLYTYEIPKNFIDAISSAESLVINASTYIQDFQGKVGPSVDSYSAAKVKLSEYLARYSETQKMSIVDLYFFTIYGNGDRQSHLIPSLLEAAKSEKEISLSPGFQLINLIHVDDVVENICRALLRPKLLGYQQHRVWEDDYSTVREIVARIEASIQRQIPCNWGSRDYNGHEMMTVWPFPYTQIPDFCNAIKFEDGIKATWDSLNAAGV
jgi:UDP-glucose 4-epimerase